jgi:hypothetical protein
MLLISKCAVAFFFLFFLHGTSIGNGQQGISYNVLWLGVCYFALQILQTLDKIYRQNNSTKPLLVAGAVN